MKKILHKTKIYFQIYTSTLWFSRAVFKRRKSDTVFILGSGDSINKIKDWSEIKEHDSLGFNFFMAHDFVPDFYFIEIPRDEYHIEALKKLIVFKGKDYWSKVSFFIKRPLWKCSDEHLDFKQLFDSIDARPKFIRTHYSGAESTNSLIEEIRSHASGLGLIHGPRLIGQGVASVESFCHFLIRCGYKKIIFVGVDLNNTKYFYMTRHFDYLREYGIHLTTGQAGQVHKTNDPGQMWGALTVTEVIEAYAKYYQSHGVQFYSYTTDSELAKFLPIWNGTAK